MKKHSDAAFHGIILYIYITYTIYIYIEIQYLTTNDINSVGRYD